MTTAPARGLLDTSVLIAQESGRRLNVEALPGEAAISTVTVAELHVGVLAAADTDTRAQRLATLDAVADVVTFPVDHDVAAAWAVLRVHVAEAGRRVNVNDLWIAATALAHRLPLFSQDEGFEPLAGVRGFQLARV